MDFFPLVFSQQYCLSENKYISCLFPLIYPQKYCKNWKRIYKWSFFNYIFPKVFPNWKRRHKWISSLQVLLSKVSPWFQSGFKHLNGILSTRGFAKWQIQKDIHQELELQVFQFSWSCSFHKVQLIYFQKYCLNWKRIHKWIFFHCYIPKSIAKIENKYKWCFFTYIFPKVLPNWKLINRWSFFHLYIPKSIAWIKTNT